MKCRTVRARLPKYQDGDIGQKQRSAIDEHLRECAECAREWAELQGTVALIESVREVEPAADFTANVLKAIGREEIQEPAAARFSLGLAFGLTGLVLTTVVVAGVAGVGPMDLSGWDVALAPMASTGAKMLALAADVFAVTLDALLTGLARPIAWILGVDVAALAVILATRRRLLSARAPRNISNLLAL